MPIPEKCRPPSAPAGRSANRPRAKETANNYRRRHACTHSAHTHLRRRANRLRLAEPPPNRQRDALPMASCRKPKAAFRRAAAHRTTGRRRQDTEKAPPGLVQNANTDAWPGAFPRASPNQCIPRQMFPDGPANSVPYNNKITANPMPWKRLNRKKSNLRIIQPGRPNSRRFLVPARPLVHAQEQIDLAFQNLGQFAARATDLLDARCPCRRSGSPCGRAGHRSSRRSGRTVRRS